MSIAIGMSCYHLCVESSRALLVPEELAAAVAD